MEDFNKGFFDQFFNGFFADCPALAVIFVIAIGFGLLILTTMAKEK